MITYFKWHKNQKYFNNCRKLNLDHKIEEILYFFCGHNFYYNLLKLLTVNSRQLLSHKFIIFFFTTQSAILTSYDKLYPQALSIFIRLKRVKMKLRMANQS